MSSVTPRIRLETSHEDNTKSTTRTKEKRKELIIIALVLFYEAFQANHSINFFSYCPYCNSKHSSALFRLPDEFSPFV